MKKIITLSMIFSSVLGWSQLFVEGDTYIYVKDRVLYSEEDLELKDAESTIYLRDFAQFFQGEDAVNSGLGELSVYQKGDATRFTYNYWSSPVGVPASSTGNKAFKISSLHDPLSNGLARGNRLPNTINYLDDDDTSNDRETAEVNFTASFDGSASSGSTGMSIAERWLFTFNPGEFYADWDYVGANGDILPGNGFTMKGTNDTQNELYEFRGTPNNGIITVPVLDGQNTLTGNPYPSALDIAAFIHDPVNSTLITGPIYFWEQDQSITSHFLNEYVGGYHAFNINSNGNVITNALAGFFTFGNPDAPITAGSVGSKRARRYAPIGQGFMVEGIGNGDIRFTNEMRTYRLQSANNSFFNFLTGGDTEPIISSSSSAIEDQQVDFNEEGYSMVPGDYKRFRLFIDFNVDGQVYTKELVSTFHDTEMTSSFDYGYEIKIFEDLSNSASFIQEDIEYLAVGFPFNEELAIPTSIKVDAPMQIEFHIGDIQNMASEDIFVFDAETNIYVNLKSQNYSVNLEVGEFRDRFEIVFQDRNILDLGEFDKGQLSVIQNNSLSTLIVKNPENLDVDSIQIIDMTGKQLLNSKLEANKIRYEFPTNELSEGVYIVTINASNNNSVFSQKIVVKH